MLTEVLNKILLIGKRDYLQIVQSKAYLFGLILLPIMIGGGFLMITLLSRPGAKEQRIAIIDRTGVSKATVIEAWEEQSRRARANPAGPVRAMPRTTFEEVKPEPDREGQLLSLSGRVRIGELFLILDIPASALNGTVDAKPEPVRYYSNSSGLDPSLFALPAAVNDGLRRVRLAQLGVDQARVPEVLRDVPLVSMNLLAKDPATGKIAQSVKRNPIEAGAVPFFLVYLLIMVVLFGSAPQMGAVAEDKMQRVFEMLLSSASAFELMAGKVLAALGASLTSSVVYIIGGLAVLAGMAMFGLAPLNVLPWFFVYLIADVAMLAALGVAIGSACGTPQDAQHLAFLLFIPTLIPMFMVTAVVQQPNGAFAVAMSFVPPFTPVIMLLRQALPTGVPWWQPWVALAGVIVWAIAVLWAASRVFRIGILSQGKVPKLGELAQWVLHG
jgi:ABC-2 type transport system permease protein